MIEGDLDMDPLLVYKAYKERWIIEESFRMYKDFDEFDETREHSDYSVMGSQFVNYMSSVLTCRLVKRFGEVKELDTSSYRDSLRILRVCQKVQGDDGAWSPRRLVKKDVEVLAKLGALSKPIVPKRRRGRPKEITAA